MAQLPLPHGPEDLKGPPLEGRAFLDFLHREEDRKRLESWGVQDLDRALLNRWEHAGIDVDHAQMAYDAADLLKAPEEQEEMRKVSKLRLQDQARSY